MVRPSTPIQVPVHSVTCAQAGLAHRAAQRWRDGQNGRGPASPAGAAAPRPCRPGQGSRGGRVAGLAAVQAAGRIKSEGWGLLVTPARVSSVPARTRVQVPVLGLGGGACDRMKRTPAGAVTVSECGRWRGGGEFAREERRPCGTGLIASDHAPARARIRVGATAPTRNPGYPPRQIGQIAPTAAIRCGRSGSRTQPDRNAGRMPGAPL